MKGKKLIYSAIIAGTLLFGAGEAQAQVKTPVDQLETEMTKLDDVYDNVVPVAIGSAAFSVGMILIKRIAFA